MIVIQELLLSDIIDFHTELEQADEFVVSNGIRDVGLISSAVSAPFQTMFGDELYPDNIDKAAKLLYGLTKNHGFVDGNKRVAIHAMITLLVVYDIHIEYSQIELVELAESVANSTFDSDKELKRISDWIKNHRI